MCILGPVLALLSVLALAQAPAGVTAERADALFQAQDWGEAAAAYEQLVKTSPSQLFHFRLGIALMNLKRHAEAIQQLQQAEGLGAPLIQVALRLAVLQARAGAPDAAFREMTRAAAAGLPFVPPTFEADPDVARLKADPRYAEFATAIDRNARPCAYDPKHKELDFWIGEWDVRSAGAVPSAPPSTNIITRVHNGCVILETYSAPGMTGQSFNIYDRSKGQWRQTWVDSTGALHEYWGELKDGNMVYEGDLPPARGQSGRQRTRMTFFNLGPDRLRQFSEQTADGGKTWQVNYDLIYTRKKQDD